MNRRRPRENPSGDEFHPTPEEVDELTERATALLDELHEVLGEMSEHLQALVTGSP